METPSGRRDDLGEQGEPTEGRRKWGNRRVGEKIDQELQPSTEGHKSLK